MISRGDKTRKEREKIDYNICKNEDKKNNEV